VRNFEERRGMMANRDTQDLDAQIMTDPYVRGRIRALTLDLVNDDWWMALQDLEHLHRALKAGPSDVAEPTGYTPPEVAGASIYYEDGGTTVEEFCLGPDERGKCPRAEEGRPVHCAGKRLATRGWDFGIAADAELCPLAALGLVKRPQEAFSEKAGQPELEISTPGRTKEAAYV